MNRDLNLTQKTGFKVNNPTVPINIRDSRGILFYTTEPLLPRVSTFNLPAGKYVVDSGYFSPMSVPVKYNMLRLPLMAQRKLPDPFDFSVTFEPNKHKCTVNFIKKQIIFDTSFKERPLPEIYFILFHEFAHQYFKTEKWCDVLAANYMLVKGFNPSQISEAQIKSLSTRQYNRKCVVTKRMIESNAQ